MPAISRREFLTKTAADATMISLLAARVATLKANPLGLPIGSQTYPHRMMIQNGDFPGLLKTLKDIGVERIELCSALGYKEFASLSDGKQTRKIIEDHGLKWRGQVAVGKGTIDWVTTFQAAKTGGVKNYFVEQNMDLTKESVAALKAMKV